MEEEINSNMKDSEFFETECPLLGRVVIQEAVAIHPNPGSIYLGADFSKPTRNSRSSSKDPSDTTKSFERSDRASSSSKGESAKPMAQHIEKQYLSAKWDLVADAKLKLSRLKRQHAEEKHELECKIIKTEHKMKLDLLQEEHNYKIKMLKKKYTDKLKEI